MPPHILFVRCLIAASAGVMVAQVAMVVVVAAAMSAAVVAMEVRTANSSSVQLATVGQQQ